MHAVRSGAIGQRPSLFLLLLLPPLPPPPLLLLLLLLLLHLEELRMVSKFI